MLSTSVDIRVRYAETDAMGVVYHANYLPWFEIARIALLEKAHLSYRELDDQGFLLPVLEAQLPSVVPSSVGSVVIVRIRGADEVGATLSDVLERYARALAAVDSKLVLVSDNPRIWRQLEVTGAIDDIGADNVYHGTEWVAETVRRAHADAVDWVAAHPSNGGRTM